MKKRYLMLSLFLILMVFLSGCHGKKFISNFELPDSFDTTQTHNISFWAKNDSNPTQRRVFDKAIEDFNQIYPNINVEIRHFSSYPELYAAILQNIGTGTTPNVAVAYPDHVASYLENPSLVVRLNELMVDTKYGLGGKELLFNAPKSTDFIEKYMDEGLVRADGASYMYTLPFMRSTECLYTNKTWLMEHQVEIPSNGIFTWNQIWDICRMAIKENPDMIPLIYQSSDNFFIEMAYQQENDFTTEAGDVLFSNFDNKKMIQELNALFKEDLFVMKANTGIYPGDKFNTGHCIFGIDSTAGSTWMGPNSPLGAEGLDDFEVMVTTIPQVDASNPMVLSQGPSLCLFNKDHSQEVLASWLFLQFLLTDDVQVNFAKTEGYSPVTSTAINSVPFQSFLNDPTTYSVQRDAIQEVMNSASYSFTTPAFLGSALVRDEVGKIINKATQSKNNNIDINLIFQQALVNCGF